jgi:streptogramin lyase
MKRIETVLQAAAIAPLCVAFAHPATADITGTTLGHVTNLSAPIYPRNLTKAADGTIWFSEELRTPHTVGYFTPSDGRVTSFPAPCDQCDGNGTRLAYIESMTVGPDGNAWFAYSYVNVRRRRCAAFRSHRRDDADRDRIAGGRRGGRADHSCRCREPFLARAGVADICRYVYSDSC